MRVKRLQLSNYRGFTSLDLDLDHPMTLLVGPNGVGKSTLLTAIAASYSSLFEQLHINKMTLVPDPSDLREGQNSGQIKAVFTHETTDFIGGHTFSTNREGFSRQAVLQVLRVTREDLFLVLFPTERGLKTAEVQAQPPPRAAKAWEALEPEFSWEIDDTSVELFWPGFARFVRWFKDREDIENEQRVAQGDLGLQDPQLKAVRDAVAGLMPGFSRLRIQRSPRPVMVITKGDTQFRLDQLSDGERNLIALTGELARRMAVASPKSDDPRQLEGVVLIDEIEQHIHPGLQREILPRLRRAFPRIQFIVSTHSPQVLSTAPRDAIVAVDNFAARRLAQGAEGRDSNAILSEIFQVTRRPAEQLAQIEETRRLIDQGQLARALEQLDTLAELVSENDEDVLALRMRLFVASAGAPPAPEASEEAP